MLQPNNTFKIKTIIEELDNKTQQVYFSNLWEMAKKNKINST